MRHIARRLLLSSSRLPSSKRLFATESAPAQEPSKVLHFRNLGFSVGEADLRELVRPYGSVSKFIHLKEQALLEMEDLQQAEKVMQHFESEKARVRGRSIYVQYSAHQEITKTDEEDPAKILFVYINNPLYAITAPVLHRVFSPHGNIEKIIVSQKNGIQGLIQFDSEETAAQAKSVLDGREIFDGCCRMEIQYSKLEDLQVKFNSDFAQDYTNNTLPSLRVASAEPSILGAGALQQQQLTAPSVLPSGFNTGYNRRRMLLVGNLDPENMDEDKLFNLFSPYGVVLRIKMMDSKGDQALVQMKDGFQAELAMNYLTGTHVFGKRMEICFSKLSFLNHPKTREYTTHENNRFCLDFVKNCSAPNKFLHAANLSADIEEQELIEFLAPHTVRNVRIFDSQSKEGKKQALIEFDTTDEATQALVSKQFGSLRNLNVRLAFSKATEIKKSSD